MKTSRLALIAALATTMSGTAYAADTLTIDPAHVWVTFTINHAGWSSAHGIFKTVSGSIVFDKDDVTKSSVIAQLDAASLDTNFDQRNSDLKSPDFLNTAEFPSITFESTAIEKTGDKTGKMTGNLTMIGATVPVTLDVTWSGVEAAYPWAPDVMRTGFTATGKISPADFGMAKVAEYGLGPDILVTIDVEAEKK
jgi:polyisoprenoid-binding protein YceI